MMAELSAIWDKVTCGHLFFIALINNVATTWQIIYTIYVIHAAANYKDEAYW